MANRPLETFKFPGVPDAFVIPKSIISSEIEVTSDNYATIITNLDDQPVNTIYSYAYNLQSNVSNLPSNKAMTIVNLAQKSTGGLGQVMLAIERNGSGDYLYFRTMGGSPAVWSSWVKVANNSDVEAVREALDNLDIETDKTLSVADKPADAKKVGDEISDIKADLTILNNGKINLVYNATFYDGYYDATPAYTGTNTEGKVTGWGVVLISVRKGDKIVISGMSRGGTNSAWLNSNNLSDIHSVFSSANNDGEKICVTDWLALSVRDSANNYETYNVAHSFVDDINEVTETFFEELDYVGNAINYTENAGYIAGDGSISSPSTTTQEVYTSKIPVKYQDVIGLRLTYPEARSMWVAYALYDSNNTFLSRTVLINENASENEANVTITSKNVAFIAFTYRTYNDYRMLICSKPYVDKDFLAENYLKKHDVGNIKYRNLEYAVKTDNLIDSDNPDWWIPESYIFWTPYIEYEAGTVLYANVLYLENAVTNSITGELHFYDAEYTDLKTTSFGTLTPASTSGRSCDDETVKYVRFKFSTGVASIKPTAQEIANSFRIHLGTKIIDVLTTDNYYGIYTVPSAMDNLRQYCSGLNNGLIKPCGPRFAMHRGLNTEAPENTSPAFELAGEGGAWGIETDIWETTDGEFVCFHDDTVDRMTDGTGNISQMSIAQIEALTIDAGANVSSYPNLKIPTMSEYLSICRRYGCVAVIEIKSITNFTSMMEAIKQNGMEHSCVFLVPSESILGKIRSVTDAPCAYLGYSSSDISSIMNIASKYTDCWLDLFVSTATEAIVKNAHNNNIPIIIWTTDNTTTADELIRIGVDVITSNSITKFA